MLIRFFDGSEINAEHVTPGWEDTYKFSIENYSPDTVGKYRMKLEIINLKYDLMIMIPKQED